MKFIVYLFVTLSCRSVENLLLSTLAKTFSRREATDIQSCFEHSEFRRVNTRFEVLKSGINEDNKIINLDVFLISSCIATS